MELTILFLVLLTVLVLGLVIFLYLRAEKALQSQSTETAKLIEQTVRLSLESAEQHRSALEDVMERTAQQQQEVLDQTTQRMEDQAKSMVELTAATQRSMDLMLTKALAGSNDQTKQVTALLQSSLALLGTNDTKAYHQVMVASPHLDTSLDPYPSIDEDEEQRVADVVAAQRAKLGDYDDAIALLKTMGVPGGGAES